MLSEKRFIAYLQYVALLSFILCISGCTGRQYIVPPVAKVIPKADTLHGDTRIDNYYWLREKSNPEVIKYLEAENKYTMLDASIPLTVIEYEEWGNPNEKEHYDYMKSYSPYDNVEAKKYPSILITAGLNDPRVQYWEPAKWAAKLRAFKTDENILLLKTKMGAGHGGASGRYDYLKDIAFEYAFIFDLFGIEK